VAKSLSIYVNICFLGKWKVIIYKILSKNVQFSFSEKSFGKNIFVTEKKVMVRHFLKVEHFCDDNFFFGKNGPKKS
jgi:hypothetical protein